MGSDCEIRIGDWVNCYYAGYWQVVDLKRNAGDNEFSDVLAIVKKGFTPERKFSVSLKYCDIRWCQKISEEELRKIEEFFHENPEKREKFDAYDGPMYGITKGWVVDLEDDEVKIYNEKLNALPKYFSLRKFNRFVEEIGLRKHMLPSSKKANYLLTIVTYPWLADESNRSPLYFLEKGIYARPQTR